MRLLLEAERSFTEGIVEETRLLLKSRRTQAEKLAFLRAEASRQHEKLITLQKMMWLAKHNPDRHAKLQRLSNVREKTLVYLEAMTRFLEAKEKNGRTLNEPPQVFASPDWDEN
jgi:hypothetical protein